MTLTAKEQQAMRIQRIDECLLRKIGVGEIEANDLTAKVRWTVRNGCQAERVGRELARE